VQKPLLSHISFLFLFHSFVTGRQHVFLLFPEVSDLLGGLKVHLIADFCIFMWLVFPLKMHKISTKTTSFFAILSLHCAEEQSIPYAVDCCKEQAFFSRKVSFY